MNPCMFELIPHFLEMGLDINAQNDNGETPLYCAVKSFLREKDNANKEKAIKMIELLMACGADRYRPDKKGKTAFDFQKECPELFPHLRNHLEIKLDECFIPDDEELLIYLLSGRCQMETVFYTNGQECDISERINQCLKFIINYYDGLPIQESYRVKLGNIIKKAECGMDVIEVLIGENELRRLGTILQKARMVSQMILPPEISDNIKIDSDIKVEYFPKEMQSNNDGSFPSGERAPFEFWSNPTGTNNTASVSVDADLSGQKLTKAATQNPTPGKQ